MKKTNNITISASTPVIELSWDRSACIKRATKDFIESLPDITKFSDEELRDGCMNAIKQAIAECNVLHGSNMAQLQKLPNSCIAELILSKYNVCSFSWTGDPENGCMVAIYQDSGPNVGTYRGSDSYFGSLVRGFEYNASRRDVDEVICILESNAKFVTPSEDPDLIAVNNGILNYKTKQLMPFSPDIYFLSKSKVNYPTSTPVNPQITMPDGKIWDFDSWLDSLSDDPEIVDLILKVCGAVLRPHVRWDRVVCLSGKKGMNGKGTICELMRQLCGDGSYASIKLSQFAKDSLVAQLLTVNAVITDENEIDTSIFDLTNFKSAVTGDSISIDRKYKSAITFKFSGLLVECLNDLPKTRDKTDSLYRRFLMIPFEKTFRGDERKYIKSDYLHRPEVLEFVIWKVMNLPDYYELPEPNACKILLNEYREYNDPVLQFVNEVFPDFSWEKVPQKFVLDLYYKWHMKNHPATRVPSRRELAEEIKIKVRAVFSDEWFYREGEHRINQNDNLKPELMIYEYGLEEWRSSAYKGTNPEKISMPVFKEKYRNMYEKL